MRFCLVLVILVAVSGCISPYNSMQSHYAQITPGMDRATVFSLLGQPINRGFRDNIEALQFCASDIDNAVYTTIWLRDDVVAGMTNRRVESFLGACAIKIPDIRWSEAPRR